MSAPLHGGRLEGKVAIITGGARGIGAAITRRFAREGAAVVAAQRTADEVELLAGSLRAEGHRAVGVEADITDETNVRALVETAVAEFDGIDILCNNAGIGGIENLLELRMEYDDAVMDTNVRGPVLCMKHVIPHMLTHGGGSVVNIASICSFVGLPESIVYCASKGAVAMATRQAALDFAERGVRVNAVAPGFIGNDMFEAYCNMQADPAAALAAVLAAVPMRRLGSEDDIASAALYLASDEARWVTGTTLVVDGGTLCR